MSRKEVPWPGLLKAALCPPVTNRGCSSVPSATEIAVKPFDRPIGEEEHPLLVSFPNDLDLSTLSVHIAPVKREDLGDACAGPEERSWDPT